MARPKAYTAEHRVADAIVPSMRDALNRAFARLQQKLTLTRARDTFAGQSVSHTLDALPWDVVQNVLTEEYETLFRDTMQRAAFAQGRLMPGVIVRKAAEFRFDITNPRAVAWIQRHAAELVQQVTEDTRGAIRRVIQRMFEDGIPADEAARELKHIVGLHERYALAVDNYRRGLTAQDMEPEVIDQRVADYANRLRRQRAETIARTESIRASAEGQQELWRQARDVGLLDPNRARRQWLLGGDPCEICESIADGGRVGLEEPFQAGDGTVHMTPPAHPRCVCAVRLVFEDAI